MLVLALYCFLQSVAEEQEKTAAELQDRERVAKELKEEKKELENVTSNLKGDLSVSHSLIKGTVALYTVKCQLSELQRSGHVGQPNIT